jgi:chromosome condensin MukBEF MukE localization factor
MEKRKSKNGRHRNIEMRRRAKKSKVSILLFVYFSPSQLEEERIFKNREVQNMFL